MALVQPFAYGLTLRGAVVGIPTLEAGRRGREACETEREDGRGKEGRWEGGREGGREAGRRRG